ncbi:uncharacterized protein LOC106165084 [Lingula anatina]|uniref:Uncharacterized protein LOC106165084 n=1 Tax=Lingula anatina TaxID=7574 RepID=A0A1S3IM78_LINAN|nr:uncharacterized protein LOC106165084 [Lingula anatina]|eukprot:XP_013398634.1 uncharacterized protein LOC106165084 [Lingula anatina]
MWLPCTQQEKWFVAGNVHVHLDIMLNHVALTTPRPVYVISVPQGHFNPDPTCLVPNASKKYHAMAHVQNISIKGLRQRTQSASVSKDAIGMKTLLLVKRINCARQGMKLMIKAGARNAIMGLSPTQTTIWKNVVLTPNVKISTVVSEFLEIPQTIMCVVISNKRILT